MQSQHTMSGVDENSLIRAAASGSLDAFNHLVMAYQDLVYHQAYSLLGERQSAEDASQESFIRAFNAIHSYRGGSFRAWLLRITANLCYDELRRHKNHTWQSLYPENEDGEEVESPAWVVDSQAFVEDIIDQAELSEQVQHSLDELPHKYRSVVNLVDVLEMDYAEAAQILEIPVGTVKSRLARARLQLKHSLSGFLAPSSARRPAVKGQRSASPAAYFLDENESWLPAGGHKN